MRATAASLALQLVLSFPAAGSTAAELGADAFDVVLLRPIQGVATVVGFGLFLPAAVMASPGGGSSIEAAWDHFVGEPAAQVIDRPLGEF